jgi:hypothetical protein
MENRQSGIRSEILLAKAKWGKLSKPAVQNLKGLLAGEYLSVRNGDVLYLDGAWYVTHSGLLRIARRKRCSGIRVQPVTQFCDSKAARWAFKATVYKSRGCKGFVGFGDADPSNVSSIVLGAEMRIAETRAVNRALRKAYGIGTCSVEELGAVAPARPAPKLVSANPKLGSSNGHSPHPLRDQLNALIQQHQLDPALVKRYAAEFCRTQSLRDASKELVEDFIATLSKKATEDLAGLKCQLNSYQTSEVRS